MLMMVFETSKHVPKTEERCCVFKNNLSVYVFALQSIYLSSKDGTSDDGL